MAKKDFYRDFSNRTSFNGKPCGDNEVLVPVLLNDEMKETLKPMGLDYDNAETWHYPHANLPVIVVFIPVEEGQKEAAMSYFHKEVSDYLKGKSSNISDSISLDAILEGRDDDEKRTIDPTGTTEEEEKYLLMDTLKMLIADVTEHDETMGKIVALLAAGLQKNEILDSVDVGKKKTQGYEFINKTQKYAKELFMEKYAN